MSTMLLATPSKLEVFQKAIRDQFEKGGTIGDVLLALGLVLSVVLLAWFLTRLQSRLTTGTKDDSWPVFHALSGKLDLTQPQRRLLTSVGELARPTHPVALLISSQFFDGAAANWQDQRTTRSRPLSSEEFRDLNCLRAALFPDESPWVYGTRTARSGLT